MKMPSTRTSVQEKSEEIDKEEEFESLINRQREQAKIIKAAQQRLDQAEEEFKNAQKELEAAKRVQMEICLQVQQFSWTDNNKNEQKTSVLTYNNNEYRNSSQSSSHSYSTNNNKNNTRSQQNADPEPDSSNLEFSQARSIISKPSSKGTSRSRLKRVPKRRQIIKETEAEFNKYIQLVAEETNQNIDGLYDRVVSQNRVRYACKTIHPGTKKLCGVERDSPCLIREHIKQRSGIRPFKCKICPDVLQFRTKWEASRHVRHNIKHKQRIFNSSVSKNELYENGNGSSSAVTKSATNVRPPQKNRKKSKKTSGRQPNTVIRRGKSIIDPVSEEFNKYMERLNDTVDYKTYYRCVANGTGQKRYICTARHGPRRKNGRECGLSGLTPFFIINHLKQKLKVPLFQCKICPEIKPFSNKVLANRHLRHSVCHAKQVYGLESNLVNQNPSIHDSFNGERGIFDTESGVANDDNSNDANEIYEPILPVYDNEEMISSDSSIQSENGSQSSSIIRINRNFNKVKLECDFRAFEIKTEPESEIEHPLESDTQITEEPLQSEIQYQPQQQLLDTNSSNGNHGNQRTPKWSCELCNMHWKSEISLKRHNLKHHKVQRRSKRKPEEMEQTDEENKAALPLACFYCEYYSYSIEAQAIHANISHKMPRVVLPKILLINYAI